MSPHSSPPTQVTHKSPAPPVVDDKNPRKSANEWTWNPATSPYYDFNNLVGFLPKDFCDEKSPHKDEDGFILALALVHNDLKNVDAAHWFLDRGAFPSSPPEYVHQAVRWGDKNGARHYVIRLKIGLVVELLELIRENPEIACSGLILNAGANVKDSASQEAWDYLTNVATGTNLPPALKRWLDGLAKIRANGTFHYYQTKGLRRSFRRAFSNPSNPKLSRPYMSLGTTMASTRFYFADAASQQLLDETMDKDEQYAALNKYLEFIASCCRFITIEYLKLRGIELQHLNLEDPFPA